MATKRRTAPALGLAQEAVTWKMSCVRQTAGRAVVNSLSVASLTPAVAGIAGEHAVRSNRMWARRLTAPLEDTMKVVNVP